MKINKPIRNKVNTTINSLLIDGEYLLKQGFHGAKHFQGNTEVLAPFFTLLIRSNDFTKITP